AAAAAKAAADAAAATAAELAAAAEAAAAEAAAEEAAASRPLLTPLQRGKLGALRLQPCVGCRFVAALEQGNQREIAKSCAVVCALLKQAGKAERPEREEEKEEKEDDEEEEGDEDGEISGSALDALLARRERVKELLGELVDLLIE
ncbi:hypothetical protein K505DRAFT_368814, partial [Melanomma pulvis-pyrius CBS 109.77]